MEYLANANNLRCVYTTAVGVSQSWVSGHLGLMFGFKGIKKIASYRINMVSLTEKPLF